MVDVQNDFCAGGALAVPGSERVVATLNDYVADAARRGLPVYASRDWHPAKTSHFEPYGGTWPVHCVRDTNGARFHDDLHLPPDAVTVDKGDQPDSHGYSAFEGRTTAGKPFLDDLQQRGITHLFVGGLATDYCVRHSVLDALDAGLTVTVLEDAIAGVDVQPGDSRRALDEMHAKGAAIVASNGVLSR